MSKPSKQQLQNGLVISYFGNSVAVEAEEGQVFQCQLRRNQPLPVVGDHIRFQLETDEIGIVTEILTRHSLLSRQDFKGKVKHIASNIDAIVVVMAPPPILSEYLIDRYLIAAELAKIKPVIVLNKTDLLTEMSQEEILTRLKPYQDISYGIVLSSIYSGLTELNNYLANKTAVLVGPSGVGKSSIIAALAKEKIRIGDVTPKGSGKHTTTATRLYHLPQGTHLIDSPGVREFNLGPVTKKEILAGFKEFKPFSKGCKFKDCAHLAEPHCALQRAVTEGKVSAMRYANYKELMKKAK